MKILINYANYLFKNSQKKCSKSAKKFANVDKVIEYAPKDIDSNFYKENKNILKNIKGDGYWLWKPYLILKTLLRDDVKNGDYVVYVDSGSRFVGSINIVIDEMHNLKQDILLFSVHEITKKWIKRDILIELDCDTPKYYNAIQSEAGLQIIKKSQFSVDFYKQLLNICTIPGLIDDSPSKAPNYKEFIENRHDQAIISIFYQKSGLKNPSLEHTKVISHSRIKDRRYSLYEWIKLAPTLNEKHYKNKKNIIKKIQWIVIVLSKLLTKK